MRPLTLTLSPLSTFGGARGSDPISRPTLGGLAAGLALLFTLAACSGTTTIGEVSQSPGAAGSSGMAGTTGTGGSVGQGGSAGSVGAGGSVDTGGTTGVGGDSGSAGAIGAGGSAAPTAGSGGGGTTAVGGQGGSATPCNGAAVYFCNDGSQTCVPNTCPGGTGGGTAGQGGSTGGALSNFPSCAGMIGTECNGGNCCDSLALPGGTIDIDGKQWTVPAFRLDKYEVTVARMRRYVAAAAAWGAAGNPTAGAGAHPLTPGSGWRTDWLATVAASPLAAAISDGLIPTWMNYGVSWGTNPDHNIGGGNPNYPIPGTDQLAVNRVPFHIAVAFCVWDGGRLPAKAEWLLAYQGGDGTARYPWGETPPAEVFATVPAPSVPTPYNDPVWNYYAIPVGSHPASVGRFGHHDLAAGLSEYMRDAAMAGGAASTGGFIELGGDERVGWESFDTSVAYPRTVGNPSWISRAASVKVTKVGAIGDMGVGVRCARGL